MKKRNINPDPPEHKPDPPPRPSLPTLKIEISGAPKELRVKTEEQAAKLFGRGTEMYYACLLAIKAGGHAVFLCPPSK